MVKPIAKERQIYSRRYQCSWIFSQRECHKRRGANRADVREERRIKKDKKAKDKTALKKNLFKKYPPDTKTAGQLIRGKQPKATKPKPKQPKSTEPRETEPKPKKPKSTGPSEAEPKPEEPKATEPRATEPRVTEPKATKPRSPPDPKQEKAPVKYGNDGEITAKEDEKTEQTSKKGEGLVLQGNGEDVYGTSSRYAVPSSSSLPDAVTSRPPPLFDASNRPTVPSRLSVDTVLTTIAPVAVTTTTVSTQTSGEQTNIPFPATAPTLTSSGQAHTSSDTLTSTGQTHNPSTTLSSIGQAHIPSTSIGRIGSSSTVGATISTGETSTGTPIAVSTTLVTAESPREIDSETSDHSHHIIPGALPREEVFIGSAGSERGGIASFSAAVRKTAGTDTATEMAATARIKHMVDREEGHDGGSRTSRSRLVETALRALADVLDEKLGYKVEFGSRCDRLLTMLAQSDGLASRMGGRPGSRREHSSHKSERALVRLRHDLEGGDLASAASLVGEQEVNATVNLTEGDGEEANFSRKVKGGSFAWVAFRFAYTIVDFSKSFENEVFELSAYHGDDDTNVAWTAEHVVPQKLSAIEIETSVKNAISDSVGDVSLLYHFRTYDTRIVAVSEVGKEQVAGMFLGGPFVPAPNLGGMEEGTPSKSSRLYLDPLEPVVPDPIRLTGLAILIFTICCMVVSMRISVDRRRKRDLWGWRVGLRDEEEVYVLLHLSMGRGANNDMAHWDDSTVMDLVNAGTTSSVGEEDRCGPNMLLFGGPLGRADIGRSSARRGSSGGRKRRSASSLTQSSVDHGYPIDSAVYS